MSDDRDSQDDSTRFAAAGANDETRFTGAPGAATTTPRKAPESTIAPGSLLGHTYQIIALLARGGMGEVYRARHAELGTEHAIKIILPELANEQRIVDLFRREASVLRTIRHDAVVAYDGVFRDENGRLYLVMEFVDGPSLGKRLRQQPLAAADVRRLRDRLADGLAVAHEKGVIHRDISPDNVILPGGDLAQAKIIDFGISKMADPSQKTIVGDDFAGKYSYVSPEQLGMFGGKVDGRSDIYSLGLVLAAAAIGEPLDMGQSPISVIEARRGVPDLGRVPQEVRADLEAMLQPDPANRPQSMRDLVSGAAAARETSRARPDERSPAGRSGVATKTTSGGNTKVIIAAIVAAMLAGGGGVGYWLWGQPSPQPPVVPVPEPQPPVPEPQPPVPEPLPPVPEPLPPVPEPQPPVPEPALPSPEQLRTQAQLVVSGLGCADLSIAVSPTRDITVTGHVAAESERRLAADRLKALSGVARVTDATELAAPLLCQAMRVLSTDTTTGTGVPSVPRIEFGAGGNRFREEDLLAIDVAATSPTNGFLTIDLIDVNGAAVYHLFPNSADLVGRAMAGNTRLDISSLKFGDKQQPIQVVEPFGKTLLVVLWTPEPLYATAPPLVEPAATDEYLRNLSNRLQQLGRANVFGRFSVLSFEPK